jgi:hypothetical protein
MSTEDTQASAADDGVIPAKAPAVEMEKIGEGCEFGRSTESTTELASTGPPGFGTDVVELVIGELLVDGSVQYCRTISYVPVVPTSWLMYEMMFS